LNRLLILASVLGLAVYFADMPLLVRSRQWLIIGMGLLVILALATAAYWRGLNYYLRSGVLLSGLLIAGIVTLAADGLYGSGRVFLLLLPFIAAIFTNRRGRWLWLAITLLSIAIIGLAMTRGWIPAPGLRPGAGNASITSWVTATANFTLLAIGGATSLWLILQGLETSLLHEQALRDELEAERGRLEVRIEARTQDLERRLVQIRTAAEVARAIAQELDIDRLLQQVCDLATERFNLYYVGVFLIEPAAGRDPGGSYAVLRAGTGEAGRQMLNAGHKLIVGGDSMIGWATSNKQPRIALDVGAEAVRFNNPYLPHTRSELALPILTGASAGETRVLGAMTVQSTQEAAFDQDDITTLLGIADSLASAIENARLFARMQASLDEVSSLHRQYLEGAWGRATSAGPIEHTYLQPGVSLERPRAEPMPPQQVSLPIRLRDQVIGNLTLEPGPGRNLRDWSPEEYALMDVIINQAALALENARLLEETQRTAENERKAAHITSQLWSATDIDSILRVALTELGTILDAREGTIEIWPVAEKTSQIADITGEAEHGLA
jgi:GAF domain-containing protein